jgi:hypothetical protein
VSTLEGDVNAEVSGRLLELAQKPPDSRTTSLT